MKQVRQAEDLNNYIYNNYFLNNNKEERNNSIYHPPYPNFTLKLSIDFFTLSFKTNPDQYTLKDILTSIGFKSVSNRKLYRGNYGWKWSFKNNHGIVADIFYSSHSPCFPSSLLKIHDPNRKVVNQLHKIFISHDINPKLSFVELTFDFFTDEVIRLREFLKSFTFMKNSRSKTGRKKTTFYLNNIRKSVRGMRIYSRPELKKVRMEVTLKSQILKRLGLSFPFDSIDSLDVTRFFSFKFVNQERLRKYLLWSNRKIMEKINQKRPGYGDLLLCQVNSLINCIVYDDCGSTPPLMEQIAAFKSDYRIPNYARFLIPYEDFIAEFMKQISGQHFLQ